MSKINTSVSIVVPVYNSENTVGRLIEKLRKTLSCFERYSIILVNDNSTDDSWNLIKSAAQNDDNIIAVNLLENAGQQLATFLGLKYADNEYIIIIDDDLAHEPDDILLLYDEIKKGYDAVYGIEKKYSKKSSVRNLGSRFRDFTFNKLTKKSKDLKVSSFRILNRKIKDKIIKADTQFIYLSMEILKHTSNIGNIFVEYKDGSESTYSFSKLFKIIVNMYIYYSNQKIIKIKPMKKDIYKIGEVVNGEKI